MVYYNDTLFRAGNAPIQRDLGKVLAFPLPVRQIPEPSPPAGQVEVPSWSGGGVQFSAFNPMSNSFAPVGAPNNVVDQLKAQTHHTGIHVGAPVHVEPHRPVFGPHEDDRNLLVRGAEKTYDAGASLLGGIGNIFQGVRRGLS